MAAVHPVTALGDVLDQDIGIQQTLNVQVSLFCCTQHDILSS